MATRKDILLHFLAELEVMTKSPGHPLPWRRKQLRRLGVQFGNQLWIGRNLRVARPGNLILGERAALGHNCQLVNHAPITIGQDFLVGNDLIVNSGTHDPLTLRARQLPIAIGHRVWCGARVTILAGVTIGDDVVIGAGSVVTRSLPSNCIAVGVPARVIKPLDRSQVTELESPFGTVPLNASTS